MQQKITKEGSPVHYVNLPSEELKKAAITQLKDGQPVWFGCDVGQRYDRASGLMDLNLYHLEDLVHLRIIFLSLCFTDLQVLSEIFHHTKII